MISNHYIIDTSSLIHLNRANPIDVYPTVWRKLTDLQKVGLLHSAIEVYHEVQRKDDAIKQWTNQNKKMFLQETERQMQIVSELLREYPSLIDPKDRFEADPWLIALALELKESKQQTLVSEKIFIITEEKKKGNRVKIPFVCEKYDLEYLTIFDMFRLEGWQF